jgi:predicted 3-demethylubiquinone-9 3-methyltransferase (glyoxalase superfamily)
MITTCLWFDDQAEEAANFYVGIFRNSKITAITRYPEPHHEKPAGAVLTVAFELDGQPFIALDGGPQFTFNQAVSLVFYCDTQQEIDGYWQKLSAGGDPTSQHCGWLKDKFGLSWQVVPRTLPELLTGPGNVLRVFQAILEMEKIDIATLQRAAVS